MKRLTSMRRRWIEVRARWVEVLWMCACDYHNIATFRCHFCGSKPPRELRELVNARPAPDIDAA
jgi:hypothetical protein